MISLPSVWLSSVVGQATIFPQRVSVGARIFLRPRPLQSARQGISLLGSSQFLASYAFVSFSVFWCLALPRLFCSKFLLAGVAGLVLTYIYKWLLLKHGHKVFGKMHMRI
jgi:hypothetical protein